ncbi:secreted protein [Melampsora americana]|nr:secreted protein [Melampsora americana]
MVRSVIHGHSFVLLFLALSMCLLPITSAQSTKSTAASDSTTATCKAQWQRQADYFDCIDTNGVYNACTSCKIGLETQEATRVYASKCRFLPGVLNNPTKRTAHKRAAEPNKEPDVQPCDWYQLEADAAGVFVPKGKIYCHQTSPTFAAYECQKLVSPPVCKGCTQPITIAKKNS